MRRVREATKTSIASGENYCPRCGIQVILAARKITHIADAHYVVVAPLCIVAGPDKTIASAHVATAVPSYVVLEWPGMSVAFWSEMVTGLDGSVIQNG